MRRFLLWPRTLFVCALLASLFAAPLRGAPAAIAIPDSHGAEVAEAVLRDGGNAVDAAVATAFVLAVTYPEAGNLGGGGFITLHHQGVDRFLDLREAAPGRASRDLYLDAQGNYVAPAPAWSGIEPQGARARSRDYGKCIVNTAAARGRRCCSRRSV
jgi:gamma-glutamyltranspeptidase